MFPAQESSSWQLSKQILISPTLQILISPTLQILVSYHSNRGAISGNFTDSPIQNRINDTARCGD